VICFEFENRRTTDPDHRFALVGFHAFVEQWGTRTIQINDFCSLVWKDNRAAHEARFLVQFFDVVCKTTT